METRDLLDVKDYKHIQGLIHFFQDLKPGILGK